MVNKYRNIFKNLKTLFLLLSLFTISSLVSSASLSSFKPSFDSIESTIVRKEVFFNYLLPAIQKKNAEIIEIRSAISNNELSNTQLRDLAKKYRVSTPASEEELLKVIERHTRDYSPFEVYTKALQEYFRAHELTENEWEKTKSIMYSVLDEYQREGYHSLLKIVENHWKKLISMCEFEHYPFESPLHKIYEEELCISPIPSLAIHCTNVNSIFGLSPNIDWKRLWEENKV